MPKVPAAEQKSDWLTPTYITLITIVTVAAQCALDYDRQSQQFPWKIAKYKFDENGMPKIHPEDMPPMPPVKEPADPETKPEGSQE